LVAYDAFFIVDEQADRGLVSLKLRGFWTVEIFQQYRTRVLDALQRVKAAQPDRRPARMWVDLRNCPVQSPDIVARLTALEKEMKPLVAKMAVLTASQLKAVQARRVGSGDGYRVSLDEQELKEWLS
jgi:hypothetical protein